MSSSIGSLRVPKNWSYPVISINRCIENHRPPNQLFERTLDRICLSLPLKSAAVKRRSTAR